MKKGHVEEWKSESNKTHIELNVHRRRMTTTKCKEWKWNRNEKKEQQEKEWTDKKKM